MLAKTIDKFNQEKVSIIVKQHQNEEKDLSVEKNFECSYCLKKFTRKLSLVLHLRSHTDERSYQCNMCSRKFKTYEDLFKHTTSHVSVKSLKCEVCGKAFARAGNLVIHKRKHENNPSEKEFLENNQVQMQEIAHQNENDFGNVETGEDEETCVKVKKFKESPFLCYRCNETFSSNVSFFNHMRKHNTKSNAKKPYKCNYCSRSYPTAIILQEHKKSHMDKNLYKCNECDKTFGQSIALKKHKNLHATEKPFECENCKKIFTLKETLIIYMRFKVGKIPYKCDNCEKVFTIDDIRMHEKNCLSKMPYECEDCKQKFVEYRAFAKHVSVECYYCKENFTNCKLKRHLETHNDVEKAGIEYCKNSLKKHS